MSPIFFVPKDVGVVFRHELLVGLSSLILSPPIYRIFSFFFPIISDTENTKQIYDELLPQKFFLFPQEIGIPAIPITRFISSFRDTIQAQFQRIQTVHRGIGLRSYLIYLAHVPPWKFPSMLKGILICRLFLFWNGQALNSPLFGILPEQVCLIYPAKQASREQHSSSLVFSLPSYIIRLYQVKHAL